MRKAPTEQARQKPDHQDHDGCDDQPNQRKERVERSLPKEGSEGLPLLALSLVCQLLSGSLDPPARAYTQATRGQPGGRRREVGTDS